MTYRVATYLDVIDPLVPVVQGMLLATLTSRFADLEPSVEPGSGVVVVTLKIDADDERTAWAKARYWIEKASKCTKDLKWTGKTTRAPEVESWT